MKKVRNFLLKNNFYYTGIKVVAGLFFYKKNNKILMLMGIITSMIGAAIGLSLVTLFEEK